MATDNADHLATQLDQLARRIRERSERMREHDADKVRLAMASGADLREGRNQFTQHGTWLPWLREACELQQRQALNYVTLAEHPAAVSAYLNRVANSGGKPSIRGALAFISPPEKKPKKPKNLAEIETPALLGAFLNTHAALFWEALQSAPEIRAELAQRSPPKTGVNNSATETATEARAVLELLRHPTSPNVETVREKVARIVRLADPLAHIKHKAEPPRTEATLDTAAWPRAMSLAVGDPGEMPDFLQREPAAHTIN